MKSTLMILAILITGATASYAQTGTDTVPKSKKAPASKTVYTCTMHPEVISDKPGKCPKCGMPLVKKAVKAPAITYTCPMHADVTSDKPGKCPKCGMELVKKK